MIIKFFEIFRNFLIISELGLNPANARTLRLQSFRPYQLWRLLVHDMIRIFQVKIFWSSLGCGWKYASEIRDWNWGCKTWNTSIKRLKISFRDSVPFSDRAQFGLKSNLNDFRFWLGLHDFLNPDQTLNLFDFWRFLARCVTILQFYGILVRFTYNNSFKSRKTHLIGLIRLKPEIPH